MCTLTAINAVSLWCAICTKYGVVLSIQFSVAITVAIELVCETFLLSLKGNSVDTKFKTKLPSFYLRNSSFIDVATECQLLSLLEYFFSVLDIGWLLQLFRYHANPTISPNNGITSDVIMNEFHTIYLKTLSPSLIQTLSKFTKYKTVYVKGMKQWTINVNEHRRWWYWMNAISSFPRRFFKSLLTVRPISTNSNGG